MMAAVQVLSLTLVIFMTIHLGSCQRDVGNFPHSCQFAQNFTKGSPQSMNTMNVEFEIGLQAGWDNFSWTTEYFCILQGVLRVTPPAGASAVKMSFNMFNPQRYSFHIGDTSSNDGEGGDSGTGGGYNAEIYGANQTLYVYKRTLNRQTAPLTKIDFFLNYPQVFLNIRITRDNLIKFDSKGRSRAYKLELQNEDMFRFDEFYIGLNRLIGDETKFGIGICGVCVDFEF